MYIQIVFIALKIMSIPLIIFVGESEQLEERKQNTLLLVLAFLFNNLLGTVIWFAFILFSVPSIFVKIMVGVIFLSYLFIINRYIKRKLDMNMSLYVMLCITAFFTGVCLF